MARGINSVVNFGPPYPLTHASGPSARKPSHHRRPRASRRCGGDRDESPRITDGHAHQGSLWIVLALPGYKLSSTRGTTPLSRRSTRNLPFSRADYGARTEKTRCRQLSTWFASLPSGPVTGVKSMYRNRPLGAESRPRSLLLLALLGLCACGNSGLASLSNREIFVSLLTDRVYLEITYDAGREDDLHCATLQDFKDFKCTIDGISLDVVSPGLCKTGPPGKQGYSFPVLTLPVERFPSDGAGQVRISDDSMQILIDLPSLFERRTTSLASAVPGTIHPGEEVVLSWMPETDLPADPLTAAFYRMSDGYPIFSLNDPQDVRPLDSSHLWLRVPDALRGDLPIAGLLSPCRISMPVARCEGAGCRISVDHSVEAVFAANP